MPFVEINGHRLEYQRLSAGQPDAPVMVFLHEGLGSIALWKDFPQRCASAAGCDALVYSRYGYGNSDPLTAPRRVDYMHEEALKTLPELLTHLSIDRPILFGHSDGASIALLYAADHPARGVIALAPHVMVEEVAITGIQATIRAFETSGLRDRLARYHAHPDSAFRGWSDIWTHPDFLAWNIESHLPRIACPVLSIQGVLDEYGTMEQVDRISRLIPQAEVLKLDGCRHSPHIDQTEAVIGAAARFIVTATNGTPNGTGRRIDKSL